MAESGGPLQNGGPPVNGSIPIVLQTVDQLNLYVTHFQKHINLELLIPQLLQRNILTREERHQLTREAIAPETRIFSLVTEVLPSKGKDILELLKTALEDTLEKDGSHGHQTLLENFFGMPPKVHSNLDEDESHQTTADAISDESEEFSLLLMNFRKLLESGNEKAITQRLKDVANYLCRLRHKKDKSHLLKENVRDKLDSTDLNFSKLFSCLESSNPPMVSESDVSILHKIVDKVLEQDEGSKKIIEPLKRLLYKYEESSGIAITKTDPQIPAGNTRINVKVMNAHRGGPKLKNGVKNSFWECIKFKYRGSGIGSVMFYWDVPEECTHQLIESFEDVCHNKVELHQLKITKVEVQLNQKPYNINLEMKIIDPVLLQAAQKQNTVADDIAPEQENLSLFLIKIDRLVGAYAEQFLSTSRKELARPYAQFERCSFREMTDVLISEDKLHCYDISYIQQFLLSILKWDTSQGSKYKESITALLTEAQEYEPVFTGRSLPSLHSQSRSHTVYIVTHFFDIHCVSYEVMMTLKYALLQLLYLSLSAFQYVGWTKVDKGCQITWKTFPENLEKVENKLSYRKFTSALEVRDDVKVDYPYSITFSCNIKSIQILLNGSPLLHPDISDCSLDVKLDMLCRVGHVCATCFIEYNWAFRLLWLHCFKPHEHQFAGKVNAVYDFAKSTLCRVRKLLPASKIEQCSVKNCTNGRKCTKAHSGIEFMYWNAQQGRRTDFMDYRRAVSRNSTVKHFSMVKKWHSIQTNPSFPAISSKLSSSNYCNKFHHLLYWEELQHIEELNKRCTDPVDVVMSDDVTVAESLKMPNKYAMVGYIVMKDADSAQYVMQASQTVRLLLTNEVFIDADVVSISFKNRIEYFSNLSMEHVPIALNKVSTANFKAYCIGHQRDTSKPVTKIKVNFHIKHRYFQDLHHAVDNLPQLMIQKLFPSAAITKRNFKQDDNNFVTLKKLQAPFEPDKLQLETISSMLSVSADAPFLLVGPFGTGKTHVLACAAAAIVNEDASAKVLIATHHNKSADTFVSKYFGTLESTKTLPPTVAPVRIASNFIDDMDKPYLVRFNDPTITKELLDERRIVVTTFLTALHFANTEKLPRGYFSHILIDEGAQTREPETIAPLIFGDKNTKVIIAGDHLQVGPKTVVLGDNALKYGLADSLMERLYSNYFDNSKHQSPWVSSLLINYRSHEAIMRLSSNLFYNSTVVSKSDSKLHPYTCYPLHFVCTSLESGTFQNISDIHHDEADVVLSEVKKYTEVWPKQWGRREKSSVCVIASSRNQVIQLQAKLNKLNMNSYYIEVLPSFDLQGREFRAIFVSTTEATDENGSSKNPTKSMTDPFVFNTVVTRAQSLVVCVGNPYFLCHLEDKIKSGNKCWSTYINCCLDCETMTFVNQCNFGQIEKEKLQNVLNHNSRRHLKQEVSAGDKIIKGYLNSLAQFELHKRVLKFSKSWGDIQWIHDSGNYDADEQDSTSDSDSDLYIKCVIDIQSWYQALARSVNNPDLVIRINGQKNLRGAFHESTVLIELLDDYSQPHNQNEKRVYIGKVVKLISLSNPTFLCEVDHHKLHRFYPINKKDPAFFNLPTLSKVENGVAIFDPQSLEDVPRVVQVFPPQLARKRIFIVQYLDWNHCKFPFPVGIVTGSISKGYTYSAGERLLCAQYKFDFAEVDDNYKPVKPVHPHKFDEIFAVIEKSGEILENGFSIQAMRDKDAYIISYYVVNIAECIEDEKLTELLKQRGVSALVKTDKLNKWNLHSMFPLSLLRNLKFELYKPCSCFRVSCLAEIKGGNITYKPLETPLKEVFGVLTKAYTLQEMESQLEAETQSDFMLLFNIARCLQWNRLGYNEATYNCIFDISETPRAQLVLKEFSSWANDLVARKLADSSLPLFPLQCTLPLNPEEKKSVCKDHGNALQTSLHNKYFLPKNGYNPLPDVKIYSKALPLLLEAINNQNVFKYLAMLTYDNLFPQLYVAAHKFRSITKAKEFMLYSDSDEVNFTASHDSACHTATFTSPLTSYFDIVVQDMLSAALNCQPSKYGKSELDFICGKANKDFKRKFDFVENMFNLQLGVTLKAFNHRIVGYVEKIDNKNRLTLSFPSHELKSLSEHQSSFSISHLLAVKSSSGIRPSSKSSSSLYEWNVKVASFNGPPSIFDSPTIFLDRLENADATIDIKVYMVSGEEEKSHFYIELDKKQLVGSVESSTVSVTQQEWKELTKIISANPEDLDKQCETAAKILSSRHKEYSQRQNFQQIAKQTVFWSGTVSKKLQQKYDPLHTWFGAAQDTALIYPKIQQIEITPFLKICVQHNSEPEKCFASNVSLVKASKESYRDIDEYMELWAPVIIAENAIGSVRTRDILLLENVYLQWPELEYCYDSYAGDYYRVPKDKFVIMKPPLDFNKSNIELFDLQRGDLLCIQYEVPDEQLEISMGFVFHMFVDKMLVNDVTKDSTESSDNDGYDHESDCESFEDLLSKENSKNVEHEKVYHLSFSQNIEKISEKFKCIITSKPATSCKVQILHISPPQRRIYRCLQNLHRSSDMAQNIACGNTDAKEIQDSKFSMEQVASILSNEKVLHLWDKPTKKLSTNQMAILRKACRSKFLIIRGPPGTGKSTVGAHLAYAFAKLNQITRKKALSGQNKNKCVVYCGSSNISVDVVAKMLCDLSEDKNKHQKHHADKLNVLRVYHKTIEESVYPNPFELLRNSEALPVNENLNLQRLKSHSLHYKIRYECGQLGETIKTLEEKFSENNQRQKFASKADRMKYRKAIREAENKILSDNIDILICTCNEMASSRIFHNIEAVQVIIDEAAMVTEPESMIPIQHAEQVILIGDHQQLQPNVHSVHAKRSGLDVSLFQRYVVDVEFDVSSLQEQFRMHKKIFEFPAEQFYKPMELFFNQATAKEMENKAKNLKMFWPDCDPTMPFVFCDVIGTEKVTDTEFIDRTRVGQESKYNSQEADKIVEIVKVLVMNYGVKQHDILALSPYQAQSKHIHDKLKANKLIEVKCTTVKSSEGNECGIVLLSTVRSLPLADIEDTTALIPDRGWLNENLGFITDKHIINVGITRCQYGLVIVGNKCLLSYDETWCDLISYCKDVPGKCFPSRSDVEKISGFSVKR